VLVHRNAGIGGFIGVESDQGTQEGGPFHHNHIPLVDEHLCHEIQALLRAMDEQYLIHIAGDAGLLHAFHQLCAQPGMAFGGSVLQRLFSLLRQYAGKCRLEFFGGEQFWVGKSAAETDDIRHIRKFQQLADGGRFNHLHAGSEFILHIRMCSFQTMGYGKRRCRGFIRKSHYMTFLFQEYTVKSWLSNDNLT